MMTDPVGASAASREPDTSFHALFLHYPDGVVLVDELGNVVAANPAASRLTGRSVEELKRLGRTGLLALVEAGAASGRSTLMRADGTRLPVEVRLVEFRDARGAPLLSVHLTDVSSRERVEGAAPPAGGGERASPPAPENTLAAQHTQLLAEATAALVTSLDRPDILRDIVGMLAPSLADCAIVDLREEGGFRRQVHASGDPACAALVPDVVVDPEHGLVDPRHLLAPVLNQGQPLLIHDISGSQLEGMAVSPEHLAVLRRIQPRSLLSVPLLTGNQHLGALTVVRVQGRSGFARPELALAQELARRTALAIDNARRYQGAESASRAKTEFLATMSHEIRIPLTAVIGYADLLESELMGPLVQEQKDSVQRIRAGAWHLVSLIEQVLSLSKIEAGKYQLQSETCDVRKIAREAADLIRPTLRADRLTLELEVPDEPIELSTDPNKLRQVLLNLLSNAVKFTPQGEIRLGLRRVGAEAVLWVQDSGVGIAPEHRKKIFEPFWQVEPFSPQRNGSGLGLAITQRLVDLLGGSISVESEVGSGSRFTVCLPLR